MVVHFLTKTRIRPSCSDPQNQHTRQDQEQYQLTKDADQHLVSSRTGRVKHWTTVDTLNCSNRAQAMSVENIHLLSPFSQRRTGTRRCVPRKAAKKRCRRTREREESARKQRTVGQTRTRLARRQLGQTKKAPDTRGVHWRTCVMRKQQRNAAGRENERKARKQRTVGQTRTRLARRQLGQTKKAPDTRGCASAHMCVALRCARCASTCRRRIHVD